MISIAGLIRVLCLVLFMCAAEAEPDSNVSRWSKLELYNKYMDTSAKLREAQSKARQYEIIMQQVRVRADPYTDELAP